MEPAPLPARLPQRFPDPGARSDPRGHRWLLEPQNENDLKITWAGTSCCSGGNFLLPGLHLWVLGRGPRWRPEKGQGWVTKGNGFCGSFPKDVTSTKEPPVWDPGAGARAGSLRAAAASAGVGTKGLFGIFYLFASLQIAMVFVYLIFSLACSQAKCRRAPGSAAFAV